MTPEEQPVLMRMATLIDQWEAAHDRRAIFLGCYRLMTSNMLDAIAAGRFQDDVWVSNLLHRFVDYYFDALACYDRNRLDAPAVWQLAFDATRDEDVTTLQHLLLGVNAHINFDLVFTLVDLLAREWAELTDERRAQRHADHTLVNRITGETVDAVQDQVIDQHSPWYDFVDKLLGPVDEWLTSRLISHWREEVWDNAVCYLAAATPEERAALRQHVEQQAMQTGKDMLKIRS
jgi:Family of unknown function (DUF5995)